jgi:hypothetical protein
MATRVLRSGEARRPTLVGHARAKNFWSVKLLTRLRNPGEILMALPGMRSEVSHLGVHTSRETENFAVSPV